MSQGNEREQQRKTLGVLFQSSQEDTWDHSLSLNAHTKMYSTQGTVHSCKHGQVQIYTKCWQVLHMVFTHGSSQMKFIWRTDVACMGSLEMLDYSRLGDSKSAARGQTKATQKSTGIFVFQGTFCLSLRKSPFSFWSSNKIREPFGGQLEKDKPRILWGKKVPQGF